MNGWRKVPFQAGQKYRVIENFDALRDSFQTNDILTFVKQTYSIYDGQTGFLFSDATEMLRVIDLHDDEALETITRRIEIINDNSNGG